MKPWLNAGYLALLLSIEMCLWWKLDFSILALTYGFVCSCRGTQLCLMRSNGTWRRLFERE